MCYKLEETKADIGYLAFVSSISVIFIFHSAYPIRNKRHIITHTLLSLKFRYSFYNLFAFSQPQAKPL